MADSGFEAPGAHVSAADRGAIRIDATALRGHGYLARLLTLGHAVQFNPPQPDVSARLAAGQAGQLALRDSGCDRYRQQVRFADLFRDGLAAGLQSRDVLASTVPRRPETMEF
jgi:hypothetical protein